MEQDTFFEQLAEQMERQLPFVAYRKPNKSRVQALLLNDFQEYRYSEGNDGFILAPFDELDDAIFFPSEESRSIETTFTSDIPQSAIESENFSEETQGKEKHIALVQKAIETITSGHLKKVVLSRKEQIKTKTTAVELFKRLLSTYTTAFVYVWYHPNAGCWLGATPETLLTMRGNHFKTMALAGTQTFKGSLDVQWGAKEREEQQMVTDEIVKNTQSLSDSLEVSEVKTVRAGNLLHLQTMISGKLTSENSELMALVKKLHPTPAVCGLPRDEAKNFIKTNETYHREFYTGFLGEVHKVSEKVRNRNPRNVENNAYQAQIISSELYVNLRCVKLEDGMASVFVGGGVTADSSPFLEWRETVEKSKTIKRLL